MSDPAWQSVYALQHRIWSAWSDSEAGAPDRVASLCARLGLRQGDTILDLGCGVGREVLAATKQGLVASGLEYSSELCHRARARLQAAGVTAHIQQGDFRALPETGLGPFDAAWFLDSALQTFRADEARRVLADLLLLLRPGGQLAVEAMNPAWWRHQTEPQVLSSPAIGPGTTTRRYDLDPVTGRLTDAVTWTPEDGHPIDLPSQELWLLSADQLHHILEDAGFAAITVCGTRNDPACPLPLADAPTLLALGRRPELPC